ncbi:signal peptidase I [Natronolimnobius sp. AArcel1]|uniref:signal peptidase I n=1 Tax=Natronolimnobius sp. AArcel1 TaxID=1679093 RepID=UPI0013EB2C93|nr:signal peptidase I [Natronolimnobius sp. AArcel1]NGM70736.1 signal peptidase I [Natronolimnobius sp. AArcel1]
MNIRKLAHIGGIVLLITLVVPFIVYAVPGVIGADHGFVVLSGSMEPELSPGDVVIVDETDPEAITDGDVITYAEADEATPVTHRVIDVQEQNGNVAYETQGDANPEPDTELVPEDNLLGSVILTIPLIGHVIQFGSTPLGIVLLVGIPVGFLVLSELWSLFQSVEHDSSDTAPDSPGETAAASNTTDDTDEVTGTAADAEMTHTRSSDQDGESADGMDGDDVVGVHAADLTLTLGILSLVMPYSIYVAMLVQTPLAITAAFATSFSFLGLGAIWLAARRSGAESDGSSAGASGPLPDGSDALNRDEGDSTSTDEVAVQDAESGPISTPDESAFIWEGSQTTDSTPSGAGVTTETADNTSQQSVDNEEVVQ